MYTPPQEKEFYTLAKALLAPVMVSSPNHDDPQDAEALRGILHWADWKYYVQSEPALADAEYDALYKKLRRIEEAHPEVITEDSPTQRVAQGLSERFPSVPHLVPMLSLDNTYNADDLRDWDTRVREKAVDATIEYCVEPKYDGASISLIYEGGKLVRGATRGDGIMGEEITPNIRQIKSIPLAADFGKDGITQIEIRGEVVIHKEVFAAYNTQRAAEGLPPLANPRNAASGTLRMLDPREVSKRRLSAILYHVSEIETQTQPAHAPQPPEGGAANAPDSSTAVELPLQGAGGAFATHYGTLHYLYGLGFPTPAKELRLFTHIDEVIDYCRDFEARRDDLPFEVDGLVVKVNSIAQQEALGMTSHHPRWAVAYKFSARQATSILHNVEYQIGRTGSITPVAKIDPVQIGGVTVTSASLFNPDVVREKDIRIGDTVLVERAGDVIPYIVKPLAELRTGAERPIIFPELCPACEEKLDRPEGEAVLRCINISCPAQVVERIIHFASKDAMDIRGLGESLVKKFYEQGIVTTIPGIYDMVWERVSALEGFGQKSVLNLQSSVEQSKGQPLHRVIFGLGIRHVGETGAKVIATAINHIRDLYDWDAERLITLEDVGPKVAASITHFFSRDENRHTIDELEKAGVNLANTGRQSTGEGGALEGKTFLFTGTLEKLKRSDAEEMVEARDGKILSGVSAKLNYLVVGADAGSKLEKAKKLGTVVVLSEDGFLEMVGE